MVNLQLKYMEALIKSQLGPKGNLYVNREGVEGIVGVEVADGIDECRKAVRRQIGAGVDWIKVSSVGVR